MAPDIAIDGRRTGADGPPEPRRAHRAGANSQWQSAAPVSRTTVSLAASGFVCVRWYLHLVFV